MSKLIIFICCVLFFGCTESQSYFMPNDWWTESYYSKDCSLSGVEYTSDGVIKQCVMEEDK